MSCSNLTRGLLTREGELVELISNIENFFDIHVITAKFGDLS